ncbi:NAD-dependent epimerase/dehydratase family protein [Paenibacillus shenyangensis]|uniref:NAD-dependent epimerase/dehydratase family protein n=1 Tax=Paenibacillus sp. A9 TaxID=1284352 RepID=UPI00036C7CB8|nr:NAD-dependent epimerase/dehydratase family protein [Paenibacillus sp. A9]
MKLHNKTVLVTGVSGTLGDKVATRCLAEGAQVKGLIRNEQQISICENLGIEAVVGDLNDRGTLEQAMQNVQFVIHAAAYLGDDRQLAEAANIKGVQTLVDAALMAGVERFVHISTVSVYGHFDEAVELEESSELSFGHSEVYLSTKCESERIVRQAEEKGLNVVVLRPGLISSEHHSHWGDQLVKQLAEAEKVDWIHPEDMAPWVHAENVAEMCILAAVRPSAVGQVYHAVDGNYPESQFRLRILQALKQQPIIPEGKPILTIYKTGKIADQLGYRPIRTFEDTLTALEEQARLLSLRVSE